MSFAFQHLVNFLMLGLIYSIVAVGFSLYFGVVDVVQFAHGDVVALGGYAGLAGILLAVAAGATGVGPVLGMIALAVLATGAAGALIGRYLVMPLRQASPINVLLITLMTGTAIREALRLFVPGGSNPSPFPMVLPDELMTFAGVSLRVSSLIIMAAGVLAIFGTHFLLSRTRLGLAVRGVAQDEETARFMGIHFKQVVILTFVLGSCLGALAGIMSGLYYRQVMFNMGLMLGVIGFCAAVVGGLGSLMGAVVGGFLFSGLQILATVALPIPSAYKDVFAFAMMICIIAVRPTGLLRERFEERV
ncbi:branched-chain amino acid ABC transporter permease [Pigmentiphaga sp. H8]|nr:branched-chain amino acid ABC transporter permease [Pigmentiphaga sp. H8]AZG11626.1 branched-chain amino acid ABC transporter permease [Pigmentiphaga sp. H8]